MKTGTYQTKIRQTQWKCLWWKRPSWYCVHTRVSALSWSEVLDVVTHTRHHRNTKPIFSVVLSACYCAVHPLSLCSYGDELWLVGRGATTGDSLMGPHCKTVGLWIRTSHTLTGRWAHYKLISCCSLPASWYSPSLSLLHSPLSLLSFLQLFITPTLLLPLFPSLFRSWPRAHPCLYAPYTATSGHLLTRHHLQASVAWCTCTVPLSVDVLCLRWDVIVWTCIYTIYYIQTRLILLEM